MLTNSISAAAMEKSMAAMWQKMQLITNNIANEDTPGYRAKRMDFEEILKNELQNQAMRVSAFSRAQSAGRIQSLQPRVYEDESTIGRADGNNVLLENEQIELTRVYYQYQALQQKISGHYSTLKYVISGGN